jgi:tetratricopeptide (TPR) repeat protein
MHGRAHIQAEVRMTKKLFIVLTLVGLLPWVSCNNKVPGEKEYARIRDSGMQGEELVGALEDFALHYPGHLDAGVDLGTYYLARGETDRAGVELRRAEMSLTTHRAGGENIPIMYGALAQLYSHQGNYQRALEYADKAHAADRENKNYVFLKGHILIAREEYAKALEIFDELLNNRNTIPTNDRGNSMSETEAENLRAYLLLLAQAERPGEAAVVLDRYFETGAFFPGLGHLAATIYRAAGYIEKASCAVWLEAEYRGFAPEGSELPQVDFFVREYADLKNAIENSSLTESQFLRYVELEPYFRLFPSYYWYFWLGALHTYPENYEHFMPILQKIIGLDTSGPFAKRAWEELTRLMGYE